MRYSPKIIRAIRFSIKTHEVYQKQKRKGKDIPYITHPLTVGLILARAAATEDVVVAGILHDTIEDSIPSRKVTPEMLTERFGKHVAHLVVSVTEPHTHRTWDEKKTAARAAIECYSHDSILLRSADVIANATETVLDWHDIGDAMFEHFSTSKEKMLGHYILTMELLLKKWSENPLRNDLQFMRTELKKITSHMGN